MTAASNPTGHAELAGSSSYRWMRCPGSIRMTAKVGGGGGGNPDARRGTFAHAVAAHILTTDKTPEVDSEFTFMDHEEEIVDIVTEEMLEHVQVYVDRVRWHGKTGAIHVEQHVDLSTLVRDAMWGTSDAVISKPTQLVVCDFKYGFYPVHLVDWNLLLDSTYGELGHINSQLLYYAAGSAHAYGWKHREIVLEIIQPRCMEVDSIQSVQITSAQLKQWAEEDLWKAAHLATSENAPLVAGDWCRFCPALHICPEARKMVQNSAVVDFADLAKPPDIPDNTIHLMEVMQWAPIIDAWLRACETAAMQLMVRGVRIPGFKLVRKRANRKWPEDMTHQEIYKKLKAAGATGSMNNFLKTEFITPAQAEKIAGKKPVNEVCEHPVGDLTVAPDSDRRSAIEAVELTLVEDFEEFGNEIPAGDEDA